MTEASHKGVCHGRRRSLAALAGLASLSLLPSLAVQAQQDLGRFPRVVAENANGETLSLPSELAGDVIIMALALDPRRQSDLVRWDALLDPIAARYPGVGVTEVVVAGRRGALERFLIEKNMRAAARSTKVRQRNFAVFEAEALFRRSLALPPNRDVFVLVMRSSGVILARQAGRPTAGKAQAVEAAVRGALSGGGRISTAVEPTVEL